MCVGATTYLTGTFTCPCSNDQLYSQTFPAGNYEFQGSFGSGGALQTFNITNFVTPEFPVGAILAVLAPIAALAGYVKFGKSSPLKAP